MDNTVDCAYTGRRSYDTTNSKIIEDSSIQQHQQQFDQHSNPNPTTAPPLLFLLDPYKILPCPKISDVTVLMPIKLSQV
jgi:hypothetical protein